MANFLEHQVAQAVGSAASTGDKLTASWPYPVHVVRWGVTAVTIMDVGAGAVIACDIIPAAGGTRVNGSVSSGFDVAGGTISTGSTDVAAGTFVYHEPKHDVSGGVSPGTGVASRGGQLRVEPGDTLVLEVTDAADTANTTSVFWVEYAPDDAFNQAREGTTVAVKKAS